MVAIVEADSPADVNVDGPRLDIAVVAPDRIQQLLAREHSPRMEHQVAQQAIFGGAEVHRPAGARDPMAGGVELDIGKVQHILRGAGVGPSHTRIAAAAAVPS